MFFKEDDKIRIKGESITTIISADTSIEGNIVTGNSIRLSGSVRGDIISKGLVIVTQDARVKGNITAESVLVAGSVEGNLNIVNKTNIESTGEVIGDITTKRLLIDEESVFSGKCTMTRGDDGNFTQAPKRPSGDEGGEEKPLTDGEGAEENRGSGRALQKTGHAEPSGSAESEEASEIEFIDVDDYRPKKGRKKKQ
ncbi:MAG: polymer-forming cytoskeletal protein [Lachnospiraceae bacterium]|nr:polymer-forming cytoskeletal protein [Lachnospiraceae bacterium]